MKEKVRFWSLKVRPRILLLPIIMAVMLCGLMGIFRPCLIEGYSMYPWVQTGDIVLVNMFSHSPERGEVAILISPKDNEILIKRVIGLPGDIVTIVDDRAYFHGLTTVDLNKHVIFGRTGSRKVYVVPEGHIFVLGDNRANSTDSREFGFVPLESIKGVVLGRIWR